MTAQVVVSREGNKWWWECAECGGADSWTTLPYAHEGAMDHAATCAALHLSRLLSDLGELETGYRRTADLFAAHVPPQQYNRGYAQGFEFAAGRLERLLRTYREGQ